MVKSIDTILSQFIEFDKVFDMKNYQQFEKEKQEVSTYRSTKPLPRLVMTLQEASASNPESAVMFRGDPEQPTKKVPPGEIFVLARNRANSNFPLPDPQASTAPQRTTGRRLWYAHQLTDGQHPTVARVVVNRIWQHHFGQGLVATTNDFGTAGQLPTHPQLLDYLAVDFVENGWKSKRLHKAILLSKTYRQESTRKEELQNIDPENKLYGRFTMQRMDAETIRDSMLSAAQKLVLKLGGPSVPVTDNGEGQVTIGTRTAVEGIAASMDDGGEAKFRRSVYIQVRRSKPLSLLEAFDMPVMNPNCDSRRLTTVAPQSLLFLNSSQILENSELLAQSIFSSSGTSQGQIEELFLRLFSHPPSEMEIQDCLQFVESQRQFHEATLKASDPNVDPADKSRLLAMASLCQTLLASNRFLYVD